MSFTKDTEVAISLNSVRTVEIFDRSTPEWTGTYEANEAFVRSVMNFLNNLRLSRGWVSLNDVRNHLGFEQDLSGQVVGWGPNKPIYFQTVRNVHTDVSAFQITFQGLELIVDYIK